MLRAGKQQDLTARGGIMTTGCFESNVLSLSPVMRPPSLSQLHQNCLDTDVGTVFSVTPFVLLGDTEAPLNALSPDSTVW